MDSLWGEVFTISWQVLAAAAVLDLTLGDPRWLPHPIIWMGNSVSYFEPIFRRLASPVAAGFVFSISLITAVFVTSSLVLALAFALHPIAGTVLQAVLLFYCFSARSLARAAMDVAAPLIKGDLSRARIMVGYIVGRETARLDKEGVARAAVETVAENFVDGFVSPLFFALLFGVPGAMTYKMVNTLDSMVGYKNARYFFFGRASARIDDAANFIPARIAVPVIALAASILSPKLGRRSFSTALTQGRNHKSPMPAFPRLPLQAPLGSAWAVPMSIMAKWWISPISAKRSKSLRLRILPGRAT